MFDKELVINYGEGSGGRGGGGEGGGESSFTHTKNGVGKCFSHAEG